MVGSDLDDTLGLGPALFWSAKTIEDGFSLRDTAK